MSTSVRELYSWYPFLPESSVDEAVKNIRDVHIEYTIPARDPVTQTSCIDGITATLVSVSGSNIVVLLTISEYNISEAITVPVVTGIDALPSTRNYAIAAGGVSSYDISHTYRLHPDCLVIRQTMPTLSIDVRTGYSMDPASEPATSGAHTLSSLAFESGHHIAFSFRNGTLRINGANDTGTGSWVDYPFTEFAAYPHRNADGLRSINGMTDDVSLTVKGSDVTLNTVSSGAAATVTIGHN